MYALFSLKRFIVSILLAAVSGFTQAQVTVLSSIQPLALLAQDLVAPGDRVERLLDADRSPHHYQLKVSDRRLLQNADIVVWIGPELETFLQKPLTQRKAPTLEAARLDDIEWPEPRQRDGDSHHDHDHHEHDRDPHLWFGCCVHLCPSGGFYRLAANDNR